MTYMLEIEYGLPDHAFYYKYAIQQQGDYDVIIFWWVFPELAHRQAY